METFTMSRKEVPRAGLVKAALAGKVTNQEGGGRPSVASECAAVQAAQGPLPSRGRAGLGASPPRPALAATSARRPPRPGRYADDHDLHGLQRRPPHREAAAAPCSAGEPRDRAPDSAGPRAAAPASPPRAPAPEPAPPRPCDGPTRSTRRQPLRLV